MSSLTPGSYFHEELGDVSSTNDVCFERARDGAQSGLWVTATRQLKGRGRRGRTWISEPGNLYASLLLVENLTEGNDIGSMPLAIAVALASAIEKTFAGSSAKIEIKWPNDVLIDGAKISGILLESEMLAPKKRALVIGCGVNVGHHPEAGLYPTTSLSALGMAISPIELFAKLFEEMQAVLKIWNGGQGLPTIRKFWLDKAIGIGEDIKVNMPNQSLVGQFFGLSMDGHLILKQDDGNQLEISAGDVFLQRD